LIDALHSLIAATEVFHSFIVAVVLSLTTAGLLFVFRSKVKLIWGSTSLSVHNFPLNEDGQNAFIATEKFYVQNTGTKPAKDIELVLSAIPSSYRLWSPRMHEPRALSNGNFAISIPSMAPGELLIIDVIDIDRRNISLLSVNCPDTLSQHVEFAPQRQFGRAMTALIGYLMLAGLVGSIYLPIAYFF